MQHFKIIAFTHKSLSIENIGKTQPDENVLKERLVGLLKNSNISEVMYLATCNRTEFLFYCEQNISEIFLFGFFKTFYPQWNEKEIRWAILSANIFHEKDALRHLFEVTSSLDSMVVGEREIITQVRNAYEKCREFETTGDFLRLVINKAVECAKQVYSETQIASNPVSIVSLAYRRLRSINVKLDAKFLIVGAGITNTTMAKYLKKHGFTNFVVFSRTLANAEKLANELEGKALPLSDLENYKNGFDVIATCTSASRHIITKNIYSSLIGDDKSRKVVIDLAVPNDFDEEILKDYDVNLIAINNLQEIAKKNLQKREKELSSCEKIINKNIKEFRKEIKERMVELMMSDVPKKVKEIREMAMNKVFAKDIEELDENSKKVLNKVITYFEKKYISMPMKMAKEIMIEK
ncbi:MAG: glutamyl-tRNA reductase [Bacteroidota bacterium]